MGWPELAAAPPAWGNAEVTQGDPRRAVVLTRLIAYRNFPGLPFPVSATPNQCAAAAERALEWIARAGFPPAAALAGLPPRIIRMLREREMLPHRAAAFPGKKGFKHLAFSPDGVSWALVNEIEHLTLGRLLPGCPAPAAAVFPVSAPEPAGGWARSERWGHLSSDPGRIGPGVSVEQVVHLPGLALARELPAARNYCLAAGLAFGPASPPAASHPGPADTGLFRIASRGRLGRTPADVYGDHLEAIAPVLRRESEMRRECLARHPDRLAARVGAALEKLESAPSLSHAELLAHSSPARLGADLGLLSPQIGRILEFLRVTAASGHLGVSSDRELAQEEEDFTRAKVVRLSLEKGRLGGI